MSIAWIIAASLIAQEIDPFPRGFQPVSREIHPGLEREISHWKKGMPPPERLLRFPHAPAELAMHCALCAGPTVGDYIFRIKDDELLKALMFDRRADNACVRAASRRLIDIRGVTAVRATLAEWRRGHRGKHIDDELATLTQLLASSYVRVKVASVDKPDVTKEDAEKALSDLKADLEAKQPWDIAYNKAADRLPDKKRSDLEGASRTHLRYHNDGIISPEGYDVLWPQLSYQLHQAHIKTLFEGKVGVYRFETPGTYWLYYVEAFYE